MKHDPNLNPGSVLSLSVSNNGNHDGVAHHQRSAEASLASVNSSVSGLSSQEAERRLLIEGVNVLQEGQHISPLHIFISQFKSLIIWVLITAGAISALMGEAMDAGAIFIIVFLNAGIGLYQEYKAERSIEALKRMTTPQAKVRRDGRVISIPSSNVVVGDILALEAGDLVAADARLVTAASLSCIESALTGESKSVTKHLAALENSDVQLGDQTNMVFMGTSVAAGTGQAIVVATAMRTEFGRIAGLLVNTDMDRETPLQHRLDQFGRILVWAGLGIVAILFGLGLLRGTRILDLTMTSISLAVAAVPEGLPAVVTVALSLGVMRMARRRALVRKLAAVETLGSTSVICTDKTGTLTVGEMTVRSLSVGGQGYQVTGDGYGPIGEVLYQGKPAIGVHAAPLLELATALISCNNAHLIETDGIWRTVGDPTEGALLAAGAKAGGDRVQIETECAREYEIPFDSSRKRSAVLRRMPNGILRAFVNGAPGALLDRCSRLTTISGIRPLTETDRKLILADASAMAKQALRVLGSAFRDMKNTKHQEFTADSVERDLVFVGLTGMCDPPRPECREAIATCRAAGIRVVMITGDHPLTATAVANELGISASSDVVTGVELDRMPEGELRKRVPHVDIYARVTAEHKLRIVRALKANGEVVAMTGDGVNDAPAIAGADIGIAMGKTGTEVTKQAADLIITDDNFATIVAAVREGRGIYDNIRKTLQYLLAGNTGELLLMTTCVFIGLPAPLLPIHLLWINLVTDGLPAFCLAADATDPDVMNRRPRRRSERIADRVFLRVMCVTGVLTAGVAFTVYLTVLHSGTMEMARASAFAVLVYAEILRSFGARSEDKPIWTIPRFTNNNLLIVVGVTMGLQVWSQHSTSFGNFLKTPTIPFGYNFILLGIGAIPLLVLEVAKVLRNWRASNIAKTMNIQ
jgi:Ca2+-transporting ATPase